MNDAILDLDHLLLAMPAGGEGAAREFYGGLLGLPGLPKPNELAARGGCWFALPNLQLHLGVEDGFTPAKKAHPAFLVRDLKGCGVGSRRRASQPLPTSLYRTKNAFSAPTRLGIGSSS